MTIEKQAHLGGKLIYLFLSYHSEIFFFSHIVPIVALPSNEFDIKGLQMNVQKYNINILKLKHSISAMNSHHIPSIRSSNKIKNNFFIIIFIRVRMKRKKVRKVFINRINKEIKVRGEGRKKKSFPFLMLSSDIFLSFRN